MKLAINITQKIWLVFAVMIAPNLIGSIFNIWYNAVHIESMLSSEQMAVFYQTTLIYNLSVYPAALIIAVLLFHSLSQHLHLLNRNVTIASERVLTIQRRVIQLPFWGAGLATVGWTLCIPVFLLALVVFAEPLPKQIYWHLPVSFIIAGLISVTMSFLAVELSSQKLLYPLFFNAQHPINVHKTTSLTLRQRGLVLAISTGVCPSVSLLLLMAGPNTTSSAADNYAIALAVATVWIILSLATAWLHSKVLGEPLNALSKASKLVRSGDFNTQVTLMRADELGVLIDDFNHMVRSLRDKAHIQETFGLHVGRRTVERILNNQSGLHGSAQEITVMFVDIRNFTERSSSCSPEQIVSLLNTFLTKMVHVVEDQHDGMVNKFLGDGFMALFGVDDAESCHADVATQAGREILHSLTFLNQQLSTQGHEAIEVGIGIHTGPAVVASIGSPRRLEYTAIGDTVNIAARIESLAKIVGAPLLFTDATRAQLHSHRAIKALPPQTVKGKSEPISIYSFIDH